MHLPWPAPEGSLIVRTSGNGGDLYKLQLELPSSLIAGGVFSGDGTSRDGIVLTRVKGDAVAARLASQVPEWLPAAGEAPPGLFERAVFRLRMRGGLLAAPAYLLRLSLSPTEEDWKSGSEEKHSWLPAALRRPFRLARKYRREDKS